MTNTRERPIRKKRRAPKRRRKAVAFQIQTFADATTGERLLPQEEWWPLLLTHLERMMSRDPRRFDLLRVRDERPGVFRAKCFDIENLFYPTQMEIARHVAELAVLFPETNFND